MLEFQCIFTNRSTHTTDFESPSFPLSLYEPSAEYAKLQTPRTER